MNTPEAVDRFMSLLNGVRPVTGRKMFGGMGLYCEGAFFAVIDDDRLYFKSDEGTDPLYDAEDAPGWVLPQGPMPYREVLPALIAAPEKLGERIDAAVEIWRKKQKPKKK